MTSSCEQSVAGLLFSLRRLVEEAKMVYALFSIMLRYVVSRVHYQEYATHARDKIRRWAFGVSLQCVLAGVHEVLLVLGNRKLNSLCSKTTNRKCFFKSTMCKLLNEFN